MNSESTQFVIKNEIFYPYEVDAYEYRYCLNSSNIAVEELLYTVKVCVICELEHCSLAYSMDGKKETCDECYLTYLSDLLEDITETVQEEHPEAKPCTFWIQDAAAAYSVLRDRVRIIVCSDVDISEELEYEQMFVQVSVPTVTASVNGFIGK